MLTEEQIYGNAIPLLELAEKAVGRRIQEAFRRLGDPFLVRQKVQEHRIKSFKSLQRKAKDRKWSMTQAIAQANDIVGYRVVCNNLQDVEREVAPVDWTVSPLP
jgi:ppGpp synthetase/RelA/SpoT-type nucleotidyltranferase